MRSKPADYWAAGLTAAALLWAVALLAAPPAIEYGGLLSTVAALLYEGAGRICHQRPERSFHLAGTPLPVCARCAGLYFAGAGGALLGWTGRRRRTVAPPRATRGLILTAALPTVLSVAAEAAGLLHSSNTFRMISALPLGAAAGWVFVRALRAESGEPALADAL